MFYETIDTDVQEGRRNCTFQMQISFSKYLFN